MDIIKNNLANILTLSRLLLLPLIIALFYVQSGWSAWLCLILYAIAAATDYFDGYIARKYNQISAFGTFLDPIIDKIFVSSLLVLLVAFGQITGGWIVLVIIIFAREFLISGLREYLAPKNIQVPVSKLAKWKTAVQMLATGFLIISGYAPYVQELGHLLLALATIITVITGFSYVFEARKHFGSS